MPGAPVLETRSTGATDTLTLVLEIRCAGATDTLTLVLMTRWARRRAAQTSGFSRGAGSGQTAEHFSKYS
jgi:hypothetical protein